MKRLKSCTLTVLMILVSGFMTQAGNQLKELKLWYNQPASKWEEALPIGNGRLGAMVFGGVTEEHLQFNEETLWTGEPHDYAHEGASNYLDEIRQLIWQGKQKEAETLAMDKFMSVPLGQKKYQPFGDLWIKFPGHNQSANYRRELDLRDAVCRTSYQVGDTKFSREYIATNPGQAIVVNLSADKNKSLNFEVFLSAIHEEFTVHASEDGTVELMVQVKDGALHGVSKLKLTTKGGKIVKEGQLLKVTNADEATIKLVAATNFVNPKDVSANPQQLCEQYLAKIKNQHYSELLQAHLADYHQYFNRFEIDLGQSGNESLPTDQRIKAVPAKMDNSLAALYVQYGRYLMLASSREGTYPANLQGIWNDKLNPSWDSKYTVNINTEMNYWPVEPLNIAECHDALFRMLEEVVPSGERVAKVHYNADGWVLHHNTDLWRGAALSTTPITECGFRAAAG
jgi:alpha-L-fucosidase 2